METITADTATLMRQASMTANEHMLHCVRYIDEKFGEGYAKAHPELLAAMIQASAQDFHTTCSNAVMQDQIGSVGMSLDSISSAIRKVADALEEVSSSIETHGE